MKANSSKIKQESQQQKPAASSASAAGMSMPAVPVLQPMLKPDVTQLYTKGAFGKLSGGKQILLQSNYKLFASGPKIQEANGIGGDISFTAGESDKGGSGLKEVIASVKKGSKLERDMQDYNPGKEFNKVKSKAVDKLLDVDALKIKYEVIIEDHVEDDKELPVDVSSRVGDKNLKLKKDQKALVKELVELTLGQLKLKEIPGLEKRVDEYLQKQLALKDRPLMPSDCKAMSSYVAGFVAGINDMDVTHLPVMAGDVYEYNAPDVQKAEWPFHYATVIMTDGEDHVTMENAAAKGSDKFSKMQYDHSWFFEMYGTGKGETFEDHYKPMIDP